MRSKGGDAVKMPDEIPRKSLFSPRDISVPIGAPVQTVYTWVAEGKLSTLQMPGRMIRIKREELIRFIAWKATSNVMEWFFDDGRR
jgi:excisionase family DNA binding protein